MAKSICVVGFDPSLRNWGIARAELDLETMELSDLALDIMQPRDEKGKQVRKNSMDLERARQLSEAAQFYADQADVICVEVPVGSQSARAMASYGVCLGVLGSLLAQGKTIIQLSPEQVKKHFTGKKDASKDLMMAKAAEMFPKTNIPRNHDGSINMSKFEHQADAIASLVCGIASADFVAMCRLLRK